ncbi:MAG: heavy metal translocating P-type ATPase [Mycoplasmatales bacterium]
MKKTYNIEGLTCAHCAEKIVNKVNSLDNVNNVNLNFVTKKITIDGENHEDIIKEIYEVEDGLTISEDKQHEEKSDVPKRIILIIIGSIFFILAMIVNEYKIILFLTAYIVVGYSTLINAVKNLFKSKLLDEFFLMSLATIAAIIIGSYTEAVAVMLFYNIGELFQAIALNKSKKSINSLLELDVDSVYVKEGNKIVRKDPEFIKVGSVIIIKPGEKVPLDCTIINDGGLINTTALTGESVPRTYHFGETLLAGMIVEDKTIEATTIKDYNNSSIKKMQELIESASEKKTNTEKFITKFAKYYTPIVVLISILLVIFLPLIGIEFHDAVYRAIILLVISCPCALVLSVPLGYFVGIGKNAKSGVLTKGALYIDQLANFDTLVVDKTGTLTYGNFTIKEFNNYSDYSQDEILKIVASGEQYSNHPIAQSIVSAYKGPLKEVNIKEVKGHGIEYKFNNLNIVVGNDKLLNKHGVKYKQEDFDGSVLYISIDNKHVASINIGDEIKEDTKIAISKLNNLGITNIIMLSGDSRRIVESVANTLGIKEYHDSLLPEDKLNFVNDLKNNNVAFVGDGINDAPVIAASDIGIAMGAMGSDIAIETSDVVLNNDSLLSLVSGIVNSRRTIKIIRQNITFALIIKIFFIILGILGVATMWEAVFSDVGVTVLAVLNSMRILGK